MRATVVMLAALAHDFGKPATTAFIDGRIRSREHEEEGVPPTISFFAESEVTAREFFTGTDWAPLFANARMLSRAMPTALEAEGTFVALNNVVSQSVPHLHIHVVPRWKGDGLFSPRLVWNT